MDDTLLPRRSLLSRLKLPLLILSILGGVTVGAGTAGVLYLRTESGNSWILDQLKEGLHGQFPNAQFHLGGLRTDLFSHWDFETIHIQDQEGNSLLQIDGLNVNYDLSKLHSYALKSIDIKILEPNVSLCVNSSGDPCWSIFESSETPISDEPPAPFEGLGMLIELTNLQIVNGAIKMAGPLDENGQSTDMVVINNLNAKVVGEIAPLGEINIERLDINGDLPDLGALSLNSGLNLNGTTLKLGPTRLGLDDLSVALNGRIEKAYTAPDISMDIGTVLQVNALEKLIGEPIPAIETPVQIDVNGPLSALNISTTIENTGGELAVEANLDLESEPLAWDVILSSDSFTVSDVLPNYVDQKTRVAGQYHVDGVGTEWPNGVVANVKFTAPEQVIYGQPISSLELEGLFENGVFNIHSLGIEHDAAQLGVTGIADVSLSTAEIEIMALVPDMRKMAQFGLEGMSGSTGLRGPLTVSWSEDVLAEYKGALEIRNLWHPSASVSYGTGSIGLQYSTEGMEYRGNLELKNIKAAGAVIKNVSTDFNGEVSPDNDIDLHAGLVVSQVMIGDGSVLLKDIDGDIDFYSHSNNLSLQTNGLELRELQLEPAGYKIEGGPLKLSLDNNELVAELSLKRKERIFFDILTRGNLESGTWKIERFTFSPTENDPWSTTKVVNLELNDDGFGEFSVDISGNRGQIQLKNDISDGEPSLFLGINELDLSYIEEVSTLLTGEQVIPEGSQGKISAKMTMSGEEGRFAEDDFIAIYGLNIPDLIKNIDLNLSVREQLDYPRLKLEMSDALQRPLSTVELHWPLNLENVQTRCDEQGLIRLQVHPHPLYCFRESLPTIPDVDGMLSAAFNLQGPACSPEIMLSSAVSLPVGIYEQRVRLDSLIEINDDGIEVDAALTQDLREQVYLKGTLNGDLHHRLEESLKTFIPPEDSDDILSWFDSMKLDIIFDELSIENTLSLVDAPKGLKGRVVGAVSIHGDPINPTIEGGGAILNGRIGHTRISSANMSFQTDQTSLTIDGNMNFKDQGSAIIAATIPKLEGGAFSVQSEGLNFPLDGALGLIAGIEKAKGNLNWEIDFKDSSPEEAFLEASILDGSLQYSPAGIHIKDLEFEIESTPTSVILNYIRASTGPVNGSENDFGALFGKGVVVLEDLSPKRGIFNFNADKLWLNHTSMAKISITGDSKVTYSPSKTNISGKFDVDVGDIVLNEQWFVEDTTLGLNPSMTIYDGAMIEEKKARVIDEVEEESSTVTADVDIVLNRKVRIQASMPMLSDYGASFAKLTTVDVDTLLDGELQIQYGDDSIEVIGDVLTPKGSIDMLGSTFLIDDGEVHFVGTNYSNPELQMKATKRLPKYGDINIELNGLVSNMTPVFSEESGQYDDTDLMSLILFGKPVSELTESEGEGNSALLSTALSSVSSSIGGSLGSALGGSMVDEVDLNPVEGSFRIGKSISEKLYLVYQKNLQAQEGENLNEFSLEWLIQSRLYAEFIAGDAMVSSADLYYRWVF